MSKQIPALCDDELAIVVGGSTPIYSNVHLGLTPSHSYGVISDEFGKNLDFQQANTLVQQFNAPTRDALYGHGNDEFATEGTISRPGARDLVPSQDGLANPLDPALVEEHC